MKRKKSRFTKTDVNTICEMQRKIDAYEDFILALSGLVQRRDSNMRYVAILKDTEMDEWMTLIWKNCEEMIKETSDDGKE